MLYTMIQITAIPYQPILIHRDGMHSNPERWVSPLPAIQLLRYLHQVRVGAHPGRWPVYLRCDRFKSTHERCRSQTQKSRKVWDLEEESRGSDTTAQQNPSFTACRVTLFTLASTPLRTQYPKALMLPSYFRSKATKTAATPITAHIT